ncbi:MAG: zf-HC2 domain-containing protein [Actinomycetota bacterium]
MTCHEAAAVLQQYLDGEIDDTTAVRVASHLDVCRDCGIEAETYERIKSTLAIRRADLPEDSVARLRDFAASLQSGHAPS